MHASYLIGLASSAVIGWIGWLLVWWRMDPYGSTWIAVPLFFLSLFIALSSTFALIGYYLRVFFRRSEIYYEHIIISLRQGVLLTFFICGCLGFQKFKVLNWWNASLFLVTILLIEAYFLSKE